MEGLACFLLPISYLEGVFRYVGESCLFHSLPLNTILNNREGHPYLLPPLIKELAPLTHG